jgi:hypothetical protein
VDPSGLEIKKDAKVEGGGVSPVWYSDLFIGRIFRSQESAEKAEAGHISKLSKEEKRKLWTSKFGKQGYGVEVRPDKDTWSTAALKDPNENQTSWKDTSTLYVYNFGLDVPDVERTVNNIFTPIDITTEGDLEPEGGVSLNGSEIVDTPREGNNTYFDPQNRKIEQSLSPKKSNPKLGKNDQYKFKINAGENKQAVFDMVGSLAEALTTACVNALKAGQYGQVYIYQKNENGVRTYSVYAPFLKAMRIGRVGATVIAKDDLSEDDLFINYPKFIDLLLSDQIKPTEVYSNPYQKRR